MDQRATRTVDSIQVLKWSTKTVDKAARVRDNQRRHRERVRNYIAELEARLAESRTKLQQAEATIKLLTEKLDMSTTLTHGMTRRDEATNTSPKTCVKDYDATRQISPLPSEQPTFATAMPRKAHSTYVDGTDVSRTRCHVNNRHCSQNAQAGWTDTASAKERESSDQAPLHVGASNPVLASSLTMEPLKYDAKAEVETYSEMLPPGTNQSTTPCRDAYVIIAEQNFAGLEVSTICSWLQPGFRRPSATQDGCRVDNQLLFTLLDHISSPGIMVSSRA